jgi:hypothetical protein
LQAFSSWGAGSTFGREEIAVVFLAAIIGIAAVFWGFFTDRYLELDDLGLFNPPYMYANYGSVTYPVHHQFRTMNAHPPLHYWVVGVLMSAGAPPYYAEAIPLLILLLLGLFSVCRSTFPYPVRIGLLVAFWIPFLCFQFGPRMRPEMHATLAWFTGLVLLESGRLTDWNPARLFAGCFLLTYASGLHYPFFPAWTGALVYVGWVLWVAEGGKRVAGLSALLGGGCAVGVPYLLLFVIPNWTEIKTLVSATGGAGGVLPSIRAQFEAYRILYWYVVYQPTWAWPLKGILWPLKIGVPLFAVTTLTLLVSRATRGLALAGLPYALFLMFFVTRKWFVYLLPEFILYCAGLGVAAGVAVNWLAGRLIPRRRWLAVLAFGILASAVLGIASPVLRTVTVSDRPRFHESAIARAAGRQILGPNALVGSRRTALFYASGAAHYYDVEYDLLQPDSPARALQQAGHPHDLAAYFRLFDAIADTPYESDWTMNEAKKSLTSWYAEGTLQLRGFYISSRTPHLNHLLLNERPTGSLQGYGLARDGRAVHFQEQPGGGYVFVAAICNVGDFPEDRPAEFAVALRLPDTRAEAQRREVRTFISTAEDFQGFRQLVLQRCSLRDEIELRREVVDVQALLATLADDIPIRFPETLAQAVESRYGPALQISLNGGWPSGFSVSSVDYLRSVAGGLPPGHYQLVGQVIQEVFRSDMQSSTGWNAYRYGPWGGLEIVPDGMSRGDSSGVYTVADSRDHLATELLALPESAAAVVFLSLWVRPPSGGNLPRVYLQDESFSVIADARPYNRRPDGWTLLAGVAGAPAGRKVRLVVQQGPGAACRLDKTLVVALSREPGSRPLVAKPQR